MSATRNSLLMITTAPVIENAGMLRLDVKFLEGMRAHVADWPGPLRCVLRRGAASVPFGVEIRPADLGFELILLDPAEALGAGAFEGVGLVLAAADDAEALSLVPLARAAAAKLVYSLEYTLETRLRIAALDRDRGPARKAWSMLWNLWQERRRRAALRGADALQANGYPVFDAYRRIQPNRHLYIDGRMRAEMLATPAEMAARAARLRAGAPLRLIHSGRLETMKGAQDLLPVMAGLGRLGVPATLDIYGAGALEAELRAGLAPFEGRVRLHRPVDFETELVPISRTNADVFLSCHRQSDPSCSYIEAMGCGLAVAGYDNRMWARLSVESRSGAVAPLGRPEALAMRIAHWHRDREALIQSAEAGLDFARAHDFPTEFKARMDHLASVLRGG